MHKRERHKYDLQVTAMNKDKEMWEYDASNLCI